MKKTVLLLAVLLAVSSIFTSCKDNEVLPPMLGYWKCTGIGANVLGASTQPMGEEFLKYFSISYFGVGTSGYYVRVGADNLSAVTSLISSTGTESWKDFLTTGQYSYDTSAGTITHTSKGESKTYYYTVSGNSMKLTEKTIDTSSSAANSVLDILNSLLGTSASTTVGVVYHYEKVSGVDAFNNLLSGSN